MVDLMDARKVRRFRTGGRSSRAFTVQTFDRIIERENIFWQIKCTIYFVVGISAVVLIMVSALRNKQDRPLRFTERVDLPIVESVKP